MGGKGGSRNKPKEPEVDPGAEAAAAQEEANAQMRDYIKAQQEQWAAYLEQEKARKEAEKAAEEERQRTIARGSAYDEIDSYYGGRIAAEETAVDAVIQEMVNEQAQRDLYGIEGSITEEDQQARIQKRFEELWSSADEQHLMEMINKWGGPEMDVDKRMAVEEGSMPYFWNPERKYTGVEYPAPPPPGKGKKPPGRGIMKGTEEPTGEGAKPSGKTSMSLKAKTPAGKSEPGAPVKGGRGMTPTQMKLLGGSQNKDLNTLLSGNDVLSLLS